MMVFFIKVRFTYLIIAALCWLPSWTVAAATGSLNPCLLQVLRILERKPPDSSIVEPHPFSASSVSSDRATVLEIAKAQLGEKDYKEFEEFYLSHFFFDRNDLVKGRFLSERQGLGVPEVFNKNGEYPFDGYLEARKLLFDTPADQIGLDMLLAAHRKLLSKDSIRPEHRPGKQSFFKPKKPQPANSEGTKDVDLGVVRSKRVGYTDRSQSPSDHVIKTTDGQELASSTIPYGVINDEYTMLLKDRISSYVEYTPLSKWHRYKDNLPAGLRKRLLRIKKRVGSLDTEGNPEVNAIRKEILTILINKALSRARDSLRLATNPEQQINAIADFYQEFMSIHPFMNGNGRVGRLLVERMLESVELPSPIWSSFGQDVVLRPEHMRLLLKDSVRLSQQYHADLKIMLENGLDYRLTPTVFLTPEKMAAIGGTQRKKIVPEEFMVWLNYAAKRKNPPENISEAIKEYVVWLLHLSYKSDPTASGIRLAPPSFIKTFGLLSENNEAYQFKIRTFYTLSKISRGLGLLQSPSDVDIVSHFAQMDGSMTGMGVSSESLSQVRSALEQFNQMLISNPKGFKRKVHDHAAANGGYWNSGYVSYTSSSSVAERFSRGFMMGRDFVRNMKAMFEIEVLDRKVGAIENEMDTQQLSAQGFKSEYETIFAGGTDPESVSRVAVTDITVDPKKVGFFHGKYSKLQSSQYRSRKKRIAERVSYDRVELREYDLEDSSAPTKTSLYQINPDGSVTKISESYSK